MLSLTKVVCIVGLTAAVAVTEVAAAPIFYFGFDVGVGIGGARPNSDAAAASFNATASGLGAVDLLDLESLAPTSATTVNPAAGVTMNFANHTTLFQTILNTDFDAANGYNTTSGGDTWALIFPDNSSAPTSLQFVFATPIQAWGMYNTGVGTVSSLVSVEFNDGSAQAFSLTGASTGGVGFFGFTDAGASISSITIVVAPNPSSGDAIGVDDVRFVAAGVAVPEPGTLAILGLGLAGLAATRRRKQ